LATDQRDYYESALLTSARDHLDKQDWAKGRKIGLEAAILLAQQ
jgi:hypothetical protein